MRYKSILSTLIGALGGGITMLVGEITSQMVTCFILMIIDIVTGLLVAAVFKQSTKTDSGALSSGAMLKGISKKLGMIVLIALAYQLDRTLNTDYIKYAVTIALIVEESISILENLGTMGIPIPTPIKKAIDLLNKEVEQ